MWPSFSSMLAWWQWMILAMVPPLIVLLYFLKLKRRPLEVPSTYLWHKSIEDLHVNTIWQRLRRNLLLFLQLLLLLLAALALLSPGCQERRLLGERFIFLIDNSASMQATDVTPSRLEEAKRQAIERIDEMPSGSVAMVVSFADTARVEQEFTDDRRRLRRAVDAIEPTSRSTSLSEALKVVSGLANPGHISDPEETRDVQIAEALPAELFILSDGGFTPVSDFSLGNLEPEFISIGLPEAGNVAVVAFNVRRSEADPELHQAYVQLENFSDGEVQAELELHRYDPAVEEHDTLINADQLELPAGEVRGVAFDLSGAESGVLELRLRTDREDCLAVDDTAWAIVSPPRPVHVLLVTAGNEPLEMVLTTESLQEIAEVTIEPPEFLEGKPYAQNALAGAYDLVIYDRCAPKEMPQANTLFVGSLPPQEGWSQEEHIDSPRLLPVTTTHPLMQWIDMRDVDLAEAWPLEVPSGGNVLIDSDGGPLLAVAPRREFEDAAAGFLFSLYRASDADGKLVGYVGWPARQSFPVFILNVLDYLGGLRKLLGSGSVRPGSPMALEGSAPGAELWVRSPDGKVTDLKGDRLGRVNFTDTAVPGPYQIRSEGQPSRWFAVNLFHPPESAIQPQAIKIGYVDIEGQAGWETGRRDIWRWLLLLGLAVLLLEWYIYNRRVYL